MKFFEKLKGKQEQKHEYEGKASRVYYPESGLTLKEYTSGLEAIDHPVQPKSVDSEYDKQVYALNHRRRFELRALNSRR